MGFPSYELYQMIAGPKTDEWIYQGLSVLTEKGYFPTILDYKLVFASRLRPGTAPRSLYGRLVDFAQRTHKFRGVSTGDVLVLRNNLEISCFFLEHGDPIPIEGFFSGPPDGGQPLTPETEHYTIPGKPDTWRVIDTRTVEGHWFFLMENEKQGASASWIVLDRNGQIVDDNNQTNFDPATIQKLKRHVHLIQKPILQSHSAQPHAQGRRKLEPHEKFNENGEYDRAASSEVGEEQNYNMIDGIRNNGKKRPGKRRSVRARLREKQQLLHGGKPEKSRVLEKR